MGCDIGIIGAMQDEVSELVSRLTESVCERVSGIDFYTGKLCGKSVVVARSGIGKVFAAICAEAMIIKYAPTLIVNTGVGGALDYRLKPCDVVIAERLVQHDMDTSALGDEVGLVSGINKIYFDADERAVEILRRASERLGITACLGTVASGDKFIAGSAEKEKIKRAFGASACEMEGAAVAHCAFVNSVPVAVIRAISDSADGSANMEYGEFLPLAVKSSAALTLALVEEY